MTAALEVQGLRIMGNGTPMVTVDHLVVQPGNPYTLMGQTGAGKSLLLQALMGTLPHGLMAEGSVRIAGVQHDPDARQQLWGTQLAMLPQEPLLALDPIMRAGSQVSEVHRWVHGATPADSHSAAIADLTTMGLESAVDLLPDQLSGGMAQRLAFAAATAGGASVLLADEPTKGLDAQNRNILLDLLAQHAAQGALLTVTHDPAVPKRLGGTLAIMRAGVIVEIGPAAQLLNAPGHPYTRELLAADAPQAKPSAQSQTPSKPIIEAKSLAASRGERTLFDRIDLTIRAGEIVGLVGPSGVGKSSLGDTLLGLLPVTAGQVRRSDNVSTLQFQKLYQDPPAAFAPQVPLKRLLEDARRLHGFSEAALADQLDTVGIDRAILERPAQGVSGGELQRVALARVLLLKPAFLFADEPVSRLDPLTARRVLEVITCYAREHHCGVLLVGHDQQQLGQWCDRTLALQPSKSPQNEPARLFEV